LSATTYLRNAWYPALWSSDLTREPLARVFLEEEILLYRRNDGQSVALSNRCPHRFAELHRGVLIDDNIRCPYHGLQFASDGRCVHNPHGSGVCPAAAKVKAYPVCEQNGLVWLWMGEPDHADHELLPNFSAILEDATVSIVRGTINIAADYRLLTDNLLDLTHVEFLHPQFGALGTLERGTTTSRVEDDVVHQRTVFENEPPGGFTALLWQSRGGSLDDVFTRDRKLQWSAPANILLTFEFYGAGHDLFIGTVHLLTPTSAGQSQYLWATTRNGRVDDKELDRLSYENTTRAFVEQDGPMVASQQKYLGDRDLLALKPVLLETDKSAVLARRILQKLISAEVPTRERAPQTGNNAMSGISS
jgi:vanillate O-demethylase monooxygenase subunit